MASKTAVWRAVNSVHGDRLVEIARKHIALANMSLQGRDILDSEIIDARIKALRKERDEIIALYEDDGN